MMKRGIVLGHVISSDGIEVDKAKIDLITNFSPPTCVKDVRYFLRHVGFYYRFIKDFSKIVKPLSNLLAKDMLLDLYKECLEAFTKLNESLTIGPASLSS